MQIARQVNETKKCKDDIMLSLSFFALTILTRLPFVSKYLYHMDSVQFALALEKYDITVHQPHPPGYFLYVMLGRLINLFVQDANTTFLSLSILFSGFAVVTIYYLGKEIFDKKIGIFAALLALTSPNLWFHGEVAVTYVLEAFFSSFVALLCWRILKGEHKYLWLSVIVIGIAGGIRQSTILFLFPLWFFSVKGVPVKKIISSLGLFAIICLLWFIPMVWMTGGWNDYQNAFKEYNTFVIGHFSVFEKGWDSFKLFSSSLLKHLIYSLWFGIFPLGLALYSMIRHSNFGSIDRSRLVFFVLWMLPAIFFFIMILYHPASYGYVLILLPALFILTSKSIQFIGSELKKVLKRDLHSAIASFVIILNALSFFLLKFPVSYGALRDHDHNLTIILENIQEFDSKNTVIFVKPYLFYSYRHFMFYLPAYRVFNVDYRISKLGETRKTFWGLERETFLSDEIILPKGIIKFVTPLLLSDKASNDLAINSIKGLIVRDLHGTNFSLVYGEIYLLESLYPELKINTSHFDNRFR